MTGISGALQIAGASVLLGGYLLLVGAAVRIVVARWWAPVWPLGLTMGVGLGTATLVVALSYRVAGIASGIVLPLGVVSALVMSVGIVRVLRAPSPPSDHVGGNWRSSASRWVTASDCAGAALATFVLLPLLRYGPTFWTAWVNDFISYAASAQVWAGTSGAPGVDFAAAHPDWFGPAMTARASHEKPMMTALLVIASVVTRLPAYQVMVPCFLVLLFILASTLMRLVQLRFGVSAILALLVTSLPFLSVVPLSRVYDAQLGQVGSAALLAAFFLLVVLDGKPTRASVAAAGSVSGVVLVSAVGSNATLVLGSAIALAGTAWWLVSAGGLQRTSRLRATLVALLVAGVLSVPFVSWFVASLADQTAGAQGGDIPLPMPWAVIGQQRSLESTSDTVGALRAWAVIAVMFMIALLLRVRRRPGWTVPRTAGVTMAVCIVANVGLVAMHVGWTNYSVHKITALLMVLVGPLVLGLMVSWAPRRARRPVLVPLVLLLLSAGYGAWIATSYVSHVMPPQLLALHDDARLRSLDALSILITHRAEDGFAALLVPSRTVAVPFESFSPSDPEFDGNYLVRSDEVPTDPGWIVEPLNDVYALARFDQTVSERVTKFTTAAAASRRHLFGSWFPAEAWGTWSAAESSTVVLGVPVSLRSDDVDLVVVGAPYADAEHPATISYVVNGVTRQVVTFASSEQRAATVRVPASDVAATNGRLRLDIVNPAPLKPVDVGGTDTRVLAFALSQVQMVAAKPR